MNFENMNIYFVLMFVFAFLAVEKVAPFELESNYLAVIMWAFIFGVGKVITQNKDKREKKEI